MKNKILSGLMVLMLVTSGLASMAGTAAAAPNASDYTLEWSKSGDFEDAEFYSGDVTGASYSANRGYRWDDTGSQLVSATSANSQVWEAAGRSGGGIYIGDNGGNVEAYDSSGTKLWTHTIANGESRFMETSSNGNVFYVTNGGTYGSLDSSGNVRFESSSGDTPFYSGDLDESRNEFYIAGDGIVRYYDLSGNSIDYIRPDYSGGSYQQVYDIDTVGSSDILMAEDGNIVERRDVSSGNLDWSTSFSSQPTAVVSGPQDTVYVGLSNGDIKLVDKSNGNIVDTISQSASINYGGIDVDSNQNIVIGTSSGLKYYSLPAQVTSVDISISGNTTEYNTTGNLEFEANATATFDDGSTQEVSEDTNSSYTFDSNIINQLNPKDTFKGASAGTTQLEISYTGPEGNTVTDTMTVNVFDPSDPKSIEITGLNSEYDEGDTDSLTATITRFDGSTQVVTTNTDTTWSSSNSTRMTVDTNGNVDALLWGDVDITVSYTESFTGTTVTDTASTTILGDPSRVEFNVSDDNPRQDTRISMTATLYYEDGRVKDVTDDITATNVTSNKPARTDFEFSNQTVVFTDDDNYTLTFSSTYDSTVVTDTADVTVRPCLCFEDYNKLSGSQQMFVFFSDWSLWAILASILVGGIVGLKFGGGSGIATTTMALAIAWVTGFVSIFVPATLILFEIFIMVVLDVQMVDFN